jgi:hypothetical protein
LIYDEVRHQAFCLDPVAAAVWKQCDGQHTIAQIAAAAGLPQESVHIALERFESDHLLEVQPVAAGEIPLALLASQSRRTLMTRLGASALLLIPAVAVISAPKAAQAYNGCVNCPPPTVTPSGSPATSLAPESAPAAPGSRPQLYNDDLK